MQLELMELQVLRGLQVLRVQLVRKALLELMGLQVRRAQQAPRVQQAILAPLVLRVQQELMDQQVPKAQLALPVLKLAQQARRARQGLMGRQVM